MASEIPDLSSPESREQLPLSLLNDHLYCPRRAALKIVEGWRSANEHTNRGDIVHEHADLPGYEVAKGVTLLRALPVWSERLGLNGKCDIVEVEFESNARPHPGHGRFCLSPRLRPQPRGEGDRIRSLRPVEFKLGRRRQWENDDAQLCAQAMCLEEMFGLAIPRGAIFHADSKRRREVEFTPELRATTESAITALHALFAPQPFSASDGEKVAKPDEMSRESEERAGVRCRDPVIPPAVFKPACEECSLFEICLPKATAVENRAARLSRDLFKV